MRSPRAAASPATVFSTDGERRPNRLWTGRTYTPRPARISSPRRLLDLGAVPREAAADAAHIAVAVTNGVEYLVTWNFRHIANAALRVRIERVCREAGYEPPVICTPNELMETGHEDQA